MPRHARPSVTEADIAREFRLQRCHGSALEALTNPAVRACLELGARVRAGRQPVPTAFQASDAKRRAANDQD